MVAFWNNKGIKIPKKHGHEKNENDWDRKNSRGIRFLTAFNIFTRYKSSPLRAIALNNTTFPKTERVLPEFIFTHYCAYNQFQFVNIWFIIHKDDDAYSVPRRCYTKIPSHGINKLSVHTSKWVPKLRDSEFHVMSLFPSSQFLRNPWPWAFSWAFFYFFGLCIIDSFRILLPPCAIVSLIPTGCNQTNP